MIRTITKAKQRHHLEALRTSSELTQIYRRMYRPNATMIPPEDIIRLLNRRKVKFVLIGTHGVGGWRSEARATQDVDILVRPSDHRRAVKAIQDTYPDLLINDEVVVTRFSDPATGKVILDLMKPMERILKAAFRNTVPVGRTHRVPDLEMALATKFAAMVSPNRPLSKKYVDAGDFIDIVVYNQDEIDGLKLRRFGEMVYKGGGAEIVKLMEDAKAGRRLKL